MKDHLNATKWAWLLMAIGGFLLAHSVTPGGLFYLFLIPWFVRMYLNFTNPVERFGGKLFFLGGLSNLLAMFTNGFRMPVTNFLPKDAKYVTDPLHFIATSSTNLLPLIDRFNLGNFLIFSVGDLIITIGVLIMIAGGFLTSCE